MKERERGRRALDDFRIKEIFVVCDRSTEMNNHMMEIICKAKTIALEREYLVSVFYTGKISPDILKGFSQCGVDILICGTSSSYIGMWQYSDLVTRWIKKRKPELVLFQSSECGKDIAAIISTRFESGLTADCIDISYEEGEGFRFVRAAICDSVIAQIHGMNCNMNIGTVKEGVFEICKVDRKSEMQLITFQVEEGSLDEKEICLDVSKVEQMKSEININGYSTVFCIGRGASSLECVERIFALARKYDACVVGTRPVIEEGILEKERQVGQSGRSIAPQLYIGFGVFGASQHVVGIRNAKKIIAINKDPKAPIFDYADYSMVADAKDILDALL